MPLDERPKIPHVGQGNAKLANEIDLQHDNIGYTNPNLHRRIDEPGDLSSIYDRFIEPMYDDDSNLIGYKIADYNETFSTHEDAESYLVNDLKIHRNYNLAISGDDSYRTVELVTHDEESEICEIP
jgi:hypothetical protein